jgi:hypothetical protein
MKAWEHCRKVLVPGQVLGQVLEQVQGQVQALHS